MGLGIVEGVGKDLFTLMELDEAHALIVGAPGTGKTLLIKHSVASDPGRRVLIVDYLGNYRGFVRWHAPLPINPLEFLRLRDLVDAVAQAVQSLYSIEHAWSPAMELVLEDAYENCQAPCSLPNLLARLRTVRYSARDDEDARKAVVRRLDALFNNRLYARRTHPLLKAWLTGEIGGSVAIDLSGVSLPEAIAYVYILLTIMARSRVAGGGFVVVDEAHYFARAGSTVLIEALRVARNYGRLFTAITQTMAGLPPEALGVFKIVVEYPTTDILLSANTHGLSTKPTQFGPAVLRARVHVIVTSQGLASMLSAWPEAPLWRSSVSVDPKALKPLPNAVSVRYPSVGEPSVVRQSRGWTVVDFDSDEKAEDLRRIEALIKPPTQVGPA